MPHVVPSKSRLRLSVAGAILSLLAGMPSVQSAGHSAGGPRPGALHAIERLDVASETRIRVETSSHEPATFSDGATIATAFLGPGESVRALASGSARSLALAATDVDRDGVLDLVTGHEVDGRGALSIRRGDARALFASTSEVDDARRTSRRPAPFLETAQVVDLPVPPDMLAAGDFDADGWADLVAARRSGRELVLLAGDGRGAFSPPRRISLPGEVVSVSAGEAYREDGLVDLAISVAGADGARVLVYSGADGALAAEPLVVPCTVPATSVAFVGARSGAGAGLVAVCGRELIHAAFHVAPDGRVMVGTIGRQALTFDVRAATVGRFSSSLEQLVLLAHDGRAYLATVAEEGFELEEWARARGDAWPAEDGDAIPSVLVTASIGANRFDDVVALSPPERRIRIASRNASLGAVAASTRGRAIAALPMRLNADALDDLVILEEESAVPSILLTRGASVITVTNANDDGPGSLRQAIFASGASPGVDTIAFNIPGAGPHTIALASPLPALLDAMVIDATTQPGYAGSPVIVLDASAATDDAPFVIANEGFDVIRGFGIERAATAAIVIFEAGGNVVEANHIGVDPTGSIARPNGGGGVFIVNSSNNTIGGTAPGTGNLISGNQGSGITIVDGSTNNAILGNTIGTNGAQTAALPNQANGVFIGDSPGNSVGGVAAGSRNLISGNQALGVGIFPGATGTLVQGNRIGTNGAGTAAIPNGSNGVYVESSSDCLIGGTTPTAANLLSGNSDPGIGVFGTETRNLLIQGNLVGTNAAGTGALGNNGDGIYIQEAGDTVVGGSAAGARNVVSGNEALGIGLFQGAARTRIQGNLIGTGVDGSQLGNFADGVYLQDSSDTIVGGTEPGEGNTIAFNGATGVLVISGQRNTIRQNSITDNGWLGIDLGTEGANANDPGDADGGANGGLNVPILTEVLAGDGATTIRGVYDSSPGGAFSLEIYALDLCDPFGYGEGQTLVATVEVATDGQGMAAFETIVPMALPIGSFVSATATDTLGNTSEFSECAQVLLVWEPPATPGGPPTNVRIQTGQGMTQPLVANRSPAGVTGYNVYTSKTSPVAATPANLFTSVPPTTTSVTVPASSGGFFVVTAVTGNGDESDPSNEAGTPGAPVLTAVRVKGGGSKLRLDGSNFTSSVLVLVDGLPFVAGAKVKKNRTRVVQKGPLIVQQTFGQYLSMRPRSPDGVRRVLLGVRNSSGAVSMVTVTE